MGRSGTFIVVDNTLDRVNAEGSMDIFNYVAYLRSRRVFMVQTEVRCHKMASILFRELEGYEY